MDLSQDEVDGVSFVQERLMRQMVGNFKLMLRGEAWQEGSIPIN